MLVHELEEVGERNAVELGSFGEGEPPLPDLLEQPELEKLLGEAFGRPKVMGERLRRKLDLDPTLGGCCGSHDGSILDHPTSHPAISFA